jgi:hypothetical protein
MQRFKSPEQAQRFLSSHAIADSDDVGRLFRSDVGHRFQNHVGRPFRMMSAGVALVRGQVVVSIG